VALPACALALPACRRPDAAREAGPVVLGPENVAIAQFGAIEAGPYLSGALEPAREAKLRAEIAASVLATFAEVGQAVQAGDLLVRLDARALRDALASARAAVATAEAALADAERNLQRAIVLFEAGGVALRDVDDARLAVATATSQLAEARANRAAAAEQLADTEIRSPISGRVSIRSVSAGDVVQPGMDLYTVIDPSSMRVRATVPAEELGALAVGAPVRFRVRGFPGRTFRGSIERIGAAADSTTRQVEILVDIPNPGGRLVADLYAEGRVESYTRQGIVLPADAIDEAGPEPAALVVRGGRAARVAVSIGVRDENAGTVEITAGIMAGDTVLVGTARAITEGTPVTVRALVDVPPPEP